MGVHARRPKTHRRPRVPLFDVSFPFKHDLALRDFDCVYREAPGLSKELIFSPVGNYYHRVRLILDDFVQNAGKHIEGRIYP